MSENTRLAAWRFFWIFGVLAIVETSVRVGWISTFFLAAPTRAAVVLWEQIVHGNALWLTAITLFEIAACLTISTVFGVLAGFLLWRYKLIGNSYEMLLAALFSSPVILAYPIFLVTFGRGSAAVIALSSIFGLIPTIINTKGAFQNVNPILLQVGASMNLTRQQMFRHILIPAVAPTIFSGFRLALTYILKSVLGLEYVADHGKAAAAPGPGPRARLDGVHARQVVLADLEADGLRRDAVARAHLRVVGQRARCRGGAWTQPDLVQPRVGPDFIGQPLSRSRSVSVNDLGHLGGIVQHAQDRLESLPALRLVALHPANESLREKVFLLPVAREGDRRGLLAGRAAQDHRAAPAPLADRLRLAQGRGAAQRRAELHHRDRRAGHPLHPRPFQA